VPKGQSIQQDRRTAPLDNVALPVVRRIDGVPNRRNQKTTLDPGIQRSL
jgi:hypothetical protein